ncbi:DUF6453 family protein [Yersinia sp. 2553 StPb PI]|uniref:DUF6453 family protein n=1 Tax=Yersinia sp. 2553 StPb PI TaxID=3117411 RepID=UPI003FA42243
MAEPILYVSPSDGGKGVYMTSGMRMLSYLGYYDNTVKDGDTTRYQDIPNYRGGEICIVPTDFGGVLSPAGSSTSFGWWVTGYYMSGTRLHLSLNTSPMGWAKFSAFEVLPPQAFGSYGLYMQNSTNVMAITDSSALGFCTWRGNVTINGSWAVPAGVIARDNAMVFANWTDSNVSLYYDSVNKVINCYQINSTGTTSSGSVNANICVFTSGFFPQQPDPGTAGLAIFNVNGQCTYSSRYAPMILAGFTSLSNQANAWVDTGVARPMIPLPSAGGLPAGNVQSGNYRAWYRSAMRMSGASITAGAGAYVNSSNTVDAPSGICPIRMPVLDTNTYF